MILKMLLLPIFAGAPSIWAPPRMIGAIGLGPDVLPPPDTFDLGVVGVGMAIHFAISIGFAIATAVAIRKLPMGTAVAVGVLLALVLYAVVFYAMTPVWPWFAGGRNWVNVFAHAVFGATAAWWYQARTTRRHEVRTPAAT